jgi:agmatinase
MRVRDETDQFLIDYVRHGMTPFFGLPSVDSSDPVKAYEGSRVVLLGIPYDGGTSQNPGARFAPYSVRRTSIFAMNAEVIGRLSGRGAVDGGNVPAPPRSPDAMRELVEQAVTDVLAAGAAPFIAGGDHSVVLPILRAVAKKLGPVAVVHVDAHTDTATASEFLGGDAFHHGAPMRHALEEGLIVQGQLHQIGIRMGHNEELTRAHAVNIYGIDEVADRGIPSIMDRVRSTIGQLPTYVTFDIDAVDPAFAPATGTPAPGGLTSREALRIVRSLSGLRIVGMDVVEVLPALDHADITSLLAASLLMEGIGALGEQA